MGSLDFRFGDQGFRQPTVLREACLHCGRPIYKGQPVKLSKIAKPECTIPGLSHEECHAQAIQGVHEQQMAVSENSSATCTDSAGPGDTPVVTDHP